MFNDKQLIIIGGGTSIQEGISNGLWEKLNGKLTFGINYSFNFFEATAQVFVDLDFYKKENEKLAKLPLVMGKEHRGVESLPNTQFYLDNSQYDPTLKHGVYKSSLCGLFALSIGCFLKPKEIFLLGYDYGNIDNKKKEDIPETHFYQGKINHRGIGKVNYYNALGRAEKDFKVYGDAPVHIYNVSLNSKIEVFPRISYKEFFEMLDSNKYNQDELRECILNELKEVQNEQRRIKANRRKNR